MSLAADRTPGVAATAHRDEKRFGRSSRLVLILALTLLGLSTLQKAYRLILPTEGWSSTTDFENDEPIFGKNLLGFPSALRAGDGLVAVEGVPLLTLLEEGSRGRVSELGYRVGQTVRFTVAQDGEALDVDVP